MGQRRLSANNAVVWVEPATNAENGRKYYTLTAYLSENAEVREPGGTITQDTILPVRGLRTYGEIIKYQDAYVPESMADSPLYQQCDAALRGPRSGAAHCAGSCPARANPARGR